MKNKKLLGAVLSFLSGCGYGIIPLLLLNISRSGDIPGVLCNLFRQLFGAALLLPFAIWRVRKLGMRFKDIRPAFLIGLFSGCVTGSLYEAFGMLPSGIAITLHYLYPFFALLLSVLVLKRKPPRGALLAVALAFAGVVLLCDLTLMPENPWFGVFVAVFSGFLCAMWMMLMDKYSIGKMDTVVYTCTSMLGAGVTLLLWNLARHQLRFDFTASQWGSFLMVAVVAILAVATLAKGICYAGSVTASILSTMEPIVCTLGSALVLGEKITGRTLLGSAIVLGAVIFLTVISGKEKPASEA